MPKQPEGKLVHKIKLLVADRRGRSFKIHGDDEGFQEIGIPDLLICHRGWFIGIEAKQSSGKLRPMQRKALHEIYDAGGVAAVVETVGQAARLLSHLEDRSPTESSKGLCFDRGTFRYDRCQFK
jgi:hypothetical protein